MRNAYIAELYDLAKKDPRIMALVADNGAIVYDKYREAYPGRFINFGIAEANMVGVAAGLAHCGKIPFCYTIAAFLTMRAFEQIRNDVCLQKSNVKLVGIGAGFVYSDLGPTHHAVEDLAMLRALPGMTLFAPADPLEARLATREAARINGPVYLRIATSKTPEIYKKDYEFVPGKAVTLSDGEDITLIATGNIVHEALKAADMLKKEGKSVRLLNMHTIKPLDRQAVIEAARETMGILTIEEHAINGGLGSAVAEALAEDDGLPVRFARMGLRGTFPKGYGTLEEMKKLNGLSAEHIAKRAGDLLESREGGI